VSIQGSLEESEGVFLKLKKPTDRVLCCSNGSDLVLRDMGLLSLCMCVCVCVWARAGVVVRVYVCACVCVTAFRRYYKDEAWHLFMQPCPINIWGGYD